MFRREFLSVLPGFSVLPFLGREKQEENVVQIRFQDKILFIKNQEVFKTVCDYGTICYYSNNKLHREDGPAIEWTAGAARAGDKYWYLNGKLHRVDGPAVELNNGVKLWYLNGKCQSR